MSVSRTLAFLGSGKKACCDCYFDAVFVEFCLAWYLHQAWRRVNYVGAAHSLFACRAHILVGYTLACYLDIACGLP